MARGTRAAPRDCTGSSPLGFKSFLRSLCFSVVSPRSRPTERPHRPRGFQRRPRLRRRRRQPQ
eukprot:4050731-Pyramimonas_sp.AAC.1